jgi:CRP-like cAMP-binding protein
MPKPAQYRTGSLIYFQGDPAEKIYILQNGKVSLVYQDIETGEDVRDSVQPGEFFGVKSALGRFPREENAVALSDTTVMAFTVPEFEAVASANTRIIMKMLKVFSNQLRRVHKQVSKLMAKEEEVPSDGLFNLGEFYLRNKRFSQAKHVFSRYLTFHPSGRFADQATKNLEMAENSLSRFGDGQGPSVAVSAPQSKAQDSTKTADEYKKGIDLISQEKYQDAFMIFKAIVDANEDQDLVLKSSYEIARCMFLLNKCEESLRYLTTMLTQYPKHPKIRDSVLLMGLCNEKIGRKDQAAAFYKKVLTMGSVDDPIAVKAKQSLKALGA